VADEAFNKADLAATAAPADVAWSRWVVFEWLACVAVLLYVYRSVLVDLWFVWMTNQDYSHGVLVAPFALYLAWRRRSRLAEVKPQPSWLGAGLLVAAFLMRIVGVRCWLGSVERLSLVVAVWGLVLLLAGRQVARLMAGPLLFLLLMVPPPQSVAAAITLPLQRFAARTSAGVLSVMGWDIVREGNVLRLPLQSLEVAEACNGLRMVFAIVTLGVAGVVAFMGRRPLWERLTLVLSMVPVAIAVNVLRIVITGIASEVFPGAVSPARAHDVAGWLMMPLALVLLWWEQRFLRRLFIGMSGAVA